jgi:DNA-binding MarR family transcriptional regulator
MDDTTAWVGYWIRAVREAYRTAMEKALRPLGVTPTQFGLLHQVQQHPGLSSASLARMNYVKPQSTQEAIAQLELAGLVQRDPHPEVGRVLQTHLTPKGADLLKRCQERVQKIEEQMLADLAPDERTQLLALLQRARAGLDRQRD